MKTKIIICPNEEKRKQLLSNHNLENKKYLTYQEFKNNYYYEYDHRALYYLMKKYGFHIDVAKVYLNNMLYIEEKEYHSEKLNFLKKLKQECINNHLFTYHPFFKDYIKENEIEVKNEYQIEKKDEELLNYHNNIPPFQWSHSVYEFSSIEKEIQYIGQEIRKLYERGIPFHNIYLVNVTEEYYYPLSKMFSYYQIPIVIPFKDSIISTKVVQDYLKEKTLPEAMTPITKKLVNIIGNLNDLEEDEISQKILIDQLKHTYFSPEQLKESVQIRDLKELSPGEEEYVFVVGFNQDSIPNLKKDIDYITDQEKEELGLYTIMEENKRERELIPYLLSNIKNLTITYKLSTPFQKYYPSSLIKDYSLEVTKQINTSLEYSSLYNKIQLGELLDTFYIYGEKSNDLLLLNSNYDIPYQTYSNQFTGINKDTYLENLPVPLRMSYTSLNQYNECKFKYYIKNVLKLDTYEDMFASFIGSLYHKILSLYKRNQFDFETEWNKYLEKRELTLKEKLLLVRIKKDLLDFIEILKKQQYLTGYDNEYYEKEVKIPLRRDISVEFIGYIDKIMYYQKMSDTYFSIVDYKSGMIDTHIEPMKYGLHMQLPIYLYLIHYGNVFDNPIFTGIYYQNILFSYPSWTPSLEEEEKKKYLLQGYSTDQTDILERFDTTYQNSEYIRSMKYTEEKGFGTYTKVMDENTLYQLLQYTKKHIDEKVEEILEGDFKINPKMIGKDNVSCEFCKFKDLCFHTNEDIVRLPKVEDLSFLGGEEE